MVSSQNFNIKLNNEIAFGNLPEVIQVIQYSGKLKKADFP